MFTKIKDFLFKNTSTRQTVAKNTFWLFLSESSGRILKFGLIVYAARILGADGWGTFSYALSLGSLIMLFSDIGLGGLITRELVQKKEQYKTFISTALLVKALFLVLSTAALFVIAPLVSHVPDAAPLFSIITIILFFDSVRDFFLTINTAFQKMERDMLVKTVMNALILVLGILFLNIKPDPHSIAIAYAIGSVVGCILIVTVITKDIRGVFSTIDISFIRTVLKTTWPFALITLIGTIMGNTDIYMLGIWRNAAEIGLYASAQRIQQFVVVIPYMITIASFPLMSQLATTDKKQFNMVLQKTISLLLLVALPMAFGGILLSSGILRLIFSAEYIGATTTLRVLMATISISFPLVALSNAVVAQNEQKSLARAYMFGVVANIILNIILIPLYGAVGSALATLASTIVITVVVWQKMKTSIGFTTVLFKIKNILIATIAMSMSILAFLFLALPTLVVIILAIAIYFGILLVLKEPLLEDIKTTIRI